MHMFTTCLQYSSRPPVQQSPTTAVCEATRIITQLLYSLCAKFWRPASFLSGSSRKSHTIPLGLSRNDILWIFTLRVGSVHRLIHGVEQKSLETMARRIAALALFTDTSNKVAALRSGTAKFGHAVDLGCTSEVFKHDM